MLKRIIKKGLSVRQAEELVRSLTEQPAAAEMCIRDSCWGDETQNRQPVQSVISMTER